MAKDLAGVDMRLQANGCRELHWHESAEWAYMLAGKARITCIDYEGKAFVDDVGPGDLWYFPSGIPHSIQGHEPDGCEFLLVFDDGKFSEYETFLISEWVARVPKNILAKNFGVPRIRAGNLPKEEQFIFFADAVRSAGGGAQAGGGQAGLFVHEVHLPPRRQEARQEEQGVARRTSSTPRFSRFPRRWPRRS